MYVRPPSMPKGRVTLPENYSGNAFTRQPIYSEMPPPTRAQVPRQESLPYIREEASDIPPEESDREHLAPTYAEFEEDRIEDAPRERDSHSPPSIFSSLLPKGALSTHFPFGHGIGSEELLILAVMLLVFLSGNESGEVDSEFILLLGLLLFAG